jgi:hypothetical protein
MMALFREGGRQAALALALLVFLLTLGLVAPSQGFSDTYPIVSPYAELSAAWWQWGILEPWATNPITDTSGANASRNQVGGVWFLAGTYVGPVTRYVTISSDKLVFFPVVEIMWTNGPIGHPLGDVLPEAETKEFVYNWINDNITSYSCKLDGNDIPIVRSQSQAFTLTVPSDDNIWNGPPDYLYPAGYYGPCVIDGYWSELMPNTYSGFHTLHFTAYGTYMDQPFSQDVTYVINFTPLPGTLLLMASGILGILGWAKKRQA